MRTFFILALGRSGTHFLATLLAQDGRGRVHHEPWPLDSRLMVLRRAGGFGKAIEPLLEERFAELMPAEGEAAFYGEVNSYLRYEAEWLRSRFDPVLIHLVRDGRDFVRSSYIRGVYTRNEPDGPILPRDDEPWAAEWGAMTRFDRLCWYWAHTNERLAATVGNPVRFEDLLRDYGIFRRRVLEPTGVEISEGTWRREIDHPRNTSRRYKMKTAAVRLLRGSDHLPRFDPLPPWREWDAARTARFWEICGPTMKRLGYPE
jgi:hypothetical protein